MTFLLDSIGDVSYPAFWLLVLLQITVALAASIAFVRWLNLPANFAHRILLASLIMVLFIPMTALVMNQLNLGVLPVVSQPKELSLTDSSMIVAPGQNRLIAQGNAADNRNDFDAEAADLSPDSSLSDNGPSLKLPDSFTTTGGPSESIGLMSKRGFWMFAVFLIGVSAFSFAMTFFSALRSIKILRKANPINNAKLQVELDCAKRTLGIEENVLLRETDQISVPVIWLWGQKKIVLPKQRSQLTDVDWHAVFLHELSHLLRRDHVSAILAELVRNVLPWHPLVRITNRMLAEFREQACDSFVLKHVQSAQSYAATLVSFQVNRQAIRHGALLSPMAADTNQLHNRVKNIMHGKRKSTSSVVVVLLTIGLAGFYSVCASLCRAEPTNGCQASSRTKSRFCSQSKTVNRSTTCADKRA